MISDISLMAWSLVTLATLAGLEFFGLRQPIRDGIGKVWTGLRAKMKRKPPATSSWVDCDTNEMRGGSIKVVGTMRAREGSTSDLDIAAPDLVWPDEPLDDLPPGLRVHAEDIESVEFGDEWTFSSVADEHGELTIAIPPKLARRPRRKRRPPKA